MSENEFDIIGEILMYYKYFDTLHDALLEKLANKEATIIQHNDIWECYLVERTAGIKQLVNKVNAQNRRDELKRRISNELNTYQQMIFAHWFNI